MSKVTQRGPYAKGEAKREEILDHAVEAIGKFGYHATSMREIASACGLSQAGLLHYYPNKESLLIAIVERREKTQTHIPPAEMDTWVNSLLERVDQNALEKPLTQLWANLVGEATDPAFPAHKYFVKRYRLTRSNFAQQFAKVNKHSSPTDEDEIKAALAAAIWDGLQNQSLLDSKFDMRRPFEYAMVMLGRYSQYK
jgi:AcrR family transcriptional regulator